MLLVLAAIFIILPILEIAMIVAVGHLIGVVPTLLLLFIFSVAGAVLAKHEGAAVWKRFRDAMKRGEVPSDHVADGFLVLLGAALLLTPGFITDAMGLLALLPISRRYVKGWLMKLSRYAVGRKFPVAQNAFRDYKSKNSRPIVVDVTPNASGVGTPGVGTPGEGAARQGRENPRLTP